ncbi:hypothetical protein T484DRAFT_2021977, partial [Baffinella frigidus]
RSPPSPRARRPCRGEGARGRSQIGGGSQGRCDEAEAGCCRAPSGAGACRAVCAFAGGHRDLPAAEGGPDGHRQQPPAGRRHLAGARGTLPHAAPRRLQEARALRHRPQKGVPAAVGAQVALQREEAPRAPPGPPRSGGRHHLLLLLIRAPRAALLLRLLHLLDRPDPRGLPARARAQGGDAAGGGAGRGARGEGARGAREGLLCAHAPRQGSGEWAGAKGAEGVPPPRPQGQVSSARYCGEGWAGARPGGGGGARTGGGGAGGRRGEEGSGFPGQGAPLQAFQDSQACEA